MTAITATKKYELVLTPNQTPDGKSLYQVRALRNIECAGHQFFGIGSSARKWLADHLQHYTVRAGDLGGYVEGEHNLSQDGDSWVGSNATVRDDARVEGDAWIIDGLAKDRALLKGLALVERAVIQDRACIGGAAYVAPLQGMNGIPIIGGTKRVGGILRPAEGIHEGAHYGILGRVFRATPKAARGPTPRQIS